MNTDPYLAFLAFAGQDDYSGEAVASVLICAAGRVQRLVSPQPVARQQRRDKTLRQRR